MSTLYIDFETFMDLKEGITLRKMALRRYLAVAPVIGFSVAIDDSPFQWIPKESAEFLPMLAEIDEFGQTPGNICTAYNVPFDYRVLRFGCLEPHGAPIGARWPLQIRDAMELAMAAWPNMPGGYSLRNVASWLLLPPKLRMSDVAKGTVTWEEYCNRDGELLREIYLRALRRVCPEEVEISEMANVVRGGAYQINAASVATALDAFTTHRNEGVAAACKLLTSYSRDGEDLGAEIFGGYSEKEVRSVKAKALKEFLVGALGFDTTSTSLKKINPSHLATRPDVHALLKETSKTSKGLYYRNRAKGLVGVSEVDMELGYFRATNTGRYSAPSPGKGINTHNLSKKDKTIAKPLRQMLALPDDLMFVRADAANVEYRVEGLLTGCSYVRDLFRANIQADPYGAFAKTAFGVTCKKGEPMRDVVAKAAVLGYGFAMGTHRAVEEMNKAVADPINAVSVSDIEHLCHGRGWHPPKGAYMKGLVTRVGCHWSVAVAAERSRDAFHLIHPEFFAVADWLQRSVEMLAGAQNPEGMLNLLYSYGGAPDRNLVNLTIDRELEFPTVRVTVLGHSMPTITWRHLSCSHKGVDGLGAVTANKGPRRVHRSLLIENITQSAARLMLVKAKLALKKRGWGTIHSVHDEILIICPRTREAGLKAKADLAEIMSPAGPLGYDWAFYAKPDDITCTRTLYEDEPESRILWAKLSTNDPTWKDHLT